MFGGWELESYSPLPLPPFLHLTRAELGVSGRRLVPRPWPLVAVNACWGAGAAQGARDEPDKVGVRSTSSLAWRWL